MSALFRPRVVELDAGHCQCVYDNLFVLYTLAEASPDNIRKVVLNIDRFATSASGPIGIIMITSVDTRPPGGDDRRAVTDVLRKHSGKLQGLAVILQAGGFKGAVIRSVAAGIFVMPNPGFPTKFFGKPMECTTWMAGRVGATAGKVQDAIDYALKQFPDDRLPE